jgi:hypothetical protein
LQVFAQVLHQVIVVRHLSGMRQRPLHGICIGTGAIPADHVNFLVTLQPGKDGFSRAIWQEIKRPARLKIDQNGSVAVRAPQGKVIYS